MSGMNGKQALWNRLGQLLGVTNAAPAVAAAPKPPAAPATPSAPAGGKSPQPAAPKSDAAPSAPDYSNNPQVARDPEYADPHADAAEKSGMSLKEYKDHIGAEGGGDKPTKNARKDRCPECGGKLDEDGDCEVCDYAENEGPLPPGALPPIGPGGAPRPAMSLSVPQTRGLIAGIQQHESGKISMPTPTITNCHICDGPVVNGRCGDCYATNAKHDLRSGDSGKFRPVGSGNGKGPTHAAAVSGGQHVAATDPGDDDAGAKLKGRQTSHDGRTLAHVGPGPSGRKEGLAGQDDALSYDYDDGSTAALVEDDQDMRGEGGSKVKIDKGQGGKNLKANAFPPSGPLGADQDSHMDPHEASKEAAKASLDTEHDKAFGHAKDAVMASGGDDCDGAAKSHVKAAAQHERAATQARTQGNQARDDGYDADSSDHFGEADKHDQAAFMHRKAASMHASGMTNNQQRTAVLNWLQEPRGDTVQNAWTDAAREAAAIARKHGYVETAPDSIKSGTTAPHGAKWFERDASKGGDIPGAHQLAISPKGNFTQFHEHGRPIKGKAEQLDAHLKDWHGTVSNNWAKIVTGITANEFASDDQRQAFFGLLAKGGGEGKEAGIKSAEAHAKSASANKGSRAGGHAKAAELHRAAAFAHAKAAENAPNLAAKEKHETAAKEHRTLAETHKGKASKATRNKHYNFGGPLMNREQALARLTANCRTEQEIVALNGLGDELLTKLAINAGPDDDDDDDDDDEVAENDAGDIHSFDGAKEPAKPAVQAGGKGAKDEYMKNGTSNAEVQQYLRRMPSAIRQVVNQAMEQDRAERFRIVSNLVRHIPDPQERNRIGNGLMRLDRRGLRDWITVNRANQDVTQNSQQEPAPLFLGNGDLRLVGNADGGGEETLDLPTMNQDDWKEWSRDPMGTGKQQRTG